MSFAFEEKYIRRCLTLAAKAAGFTAPNPMVGAVLVHGDRVIGEGWHEVHGGPHAEVNCFNSVRPEDQHLLEHAVLYVSLEPCAHFGKTPPCADLIIAKGVRKVVVGIRDPFEAVNGKGIEKLKNAGVEVEMSSLTTECYALNRRFFTFHTKHRPYIILKWAQTADGFIGSNSNDRLMISNDQTNKLVHRWRSEESAILVGTNTAIKDDPSLTVRNWNGKNPVRMIIDRSLKLDTALQVFNQDATTIILNEKVENLQDNLIYKQIDFSNLPGAVAQICFEMKLLSVLIEGGAQTLQTFIDNNYWNEARVITNTTMKVIEGTRAPLLSSFAREESFELENDRIDIYKPLT